MNIKLTNFIPKGDTDGWLIALEGNHEVPFQIKRAYYIYGTRPGITRGRHAHRRLRQLAVCVRGSCRFYMDDGRDQTEIMLDRPNLGMLIEPMVWHEMSDFSDDCVMLVLASDPYDEQDYIRSRNEFMSLVAKKMG